MPKKKANKQAVDDWENDVEEMEAEATQPEVSVKSAPVAETVDDIDGMWSDDDNKKKKKGKNGKQAPAEEAAKPEKPQETGGVKTKAQKAAEKKEREKQKKKEQAAKKKGGQKEKTVAEIAAELAAQDEEPQVKSKKGKKGEEEKTKKKKGGPPAAALREMLAAQQAQEEAEKKAREEEEAKAAEALRKHNEKLEQERLRRAKKNEREKQRLARRKEEGKALTDKEKIAKARAEALLADRGINVDDVEDEVKAAPVKILSKAQKKKLMEEERRQREANEAPAASAVQEVVAKKVEVKKDSPDVSNAEDESSGDDWDNSSDDEAENAEPEEVAKEPTPKASRDNEDVSVKHSGARPDDFFEVADVHKRIKKRRKYNKEQAIEGDFRCPIVCVLGHVDTGKTKCLDNLRRTNVQDGEAGGITQHIGATNMPLDCIEKRTSFVKKVAFGDKLDIQIPGLLIIDTPGHESFSNLRSRGSSLCDVAILVVDIMHGLENQTRESIKLLKKKRCPFVVALNKIDRIYEWKSSPHQDVRKTIDNQKEGTKNQFKKLYDNVYTQMAVEELNIKLFWELTTEEAGEWIPIVPTSAITGDGMGNLIAQVIDSAQNIVGKKITYNPGVKCTVMEVKAIEGLGKSIDAILVNGCLQNGDQMVLAGQQGPFATHIRQIYTPPANKDLRVKNAWVKHDRVKGATGVKVVGRGDDIEKSLAGMPMYIARKDDEVEYFKGELEEEIGDALDAIRTSSEGVYVQASTLGSLEALLEFLRTEKVKYSNINIGPVNKRDIMKASTMLEHDEKYGVVLAFDVPVTRDAQELAESFKPPIKIFTANIIYHLTDMFEKHLKDQKKRRQEELKEIAIFPAKMSIMPDCIFAKRDPIVVGVKIDDGQLRVGAPICVPNKENMCIGAVSSIESSGKPVDSAKKGEEVCIKIENTTGDAAKMIGRHFEKTDGLVTRISRDGIDALKEWFRDDMTKQDWKLCIELKKTFKIL